MHAMKKFAAIALAALFAVGLTTSALADTDPKKPVATATTAKMKKKDGVQGCIRVPSK